MDNVPRWRGVGQKLGLGPVQGWTGGFAGARVHVTAYSRPPSSLHCWEERCKRRHHNIYKTINHFDSSLLSIQSITIDWVVRIRVRLEMYGGSLFASKMSFGCCQVIQGCLRSDGRGYFSAFPPPKSATRHSVVSRGLGSTYIRTFALIG